MAKIEAMSPQKITRIATLAREGKTQSVRTRYTNELNRLYKQYQRSANSRLLNLRKEGFDYGEAYDEAMSYITRYDSAEARFFHKPITLSGVESQLKVLSAFLRDPTSTVRYQRAEVARAEGALNIIHDVIHTKQGLYRSARGTQAWYSAKEFLKFAGAREVKELLSLYISTDDAMEKLYTLWDSDPEKLKSAVDRFSEYQEDPTQGMTASEVLTWIDSKYGDIRKRSRV